MRLWHYAMVDSLPKNQLLSQWRECVCIAKSIYENNTPNHILVNRIMDYNLEEFCAYCNIVLKVLKKRNYNVTRASLDKLRHYVGFIPLYDIDGKLVEESVFKDWHNKTYLDVCYYNLFEKYYYAKGNSKLTDREWSILLRKYYEITNQIFEA